MKSRISHLKVIFLVKLGLGKISIVSISSFCKTKPILKMCKIFVCTLIRISNGSAVTRTGLVGWDQDQDYGCFHGPPNRDRVTDPYQ